MPKDHPMKPTQEAAFWKTHFNLEDDKIYKVEPVIHRLNFRESLVDDDFLFYVTTRIKVIEQLDLDYTMITDKGVEYLRRFEILHELRLKGCSEITKGCLLHLNEITSLTLLHLGRTSILPEDALVLTKLQNLKHLLLSSDEPQEIMQQKADALKEILPGCAININYKILAD